jgi:pilus assembly protein Flp/PilA
MSKFVSRFVKNESGATAIEYGLIAALIAVALIAVFNVFSPMLVTAFTSIGTTLTTNAATPAP